MISFKLPELGENIDAAEVTRLLVKEGDAVAAEQSVMELESEKASFPLPAPQAGKVARIHVKEGDTIHVGQPLLDIEEAAAGKPTPRGESSSPEGKTTERDKPTPRGESSSPEGKTTDQKRPEEKSHAVEPAKAPSAPSPDGAAPSEKRPPAPAGPATRKLARELGVDLFHVSGSGASGRITCDDVKAYVQRRMTAPAAQTVEAPPLPDFARFGPVRRQRLSVLARTAAERLSLAWRMIPHVTQHDLADITDLEAARMQFNQQNPAPKPKITMTVLAVRAVVAALKSFPHVNSSLDAGSGELILKDYYHIGVAVDTPHGLLVPVLRDADKKTLVELAAELAELAGKARGKALMPGHMEGGTFTISNLGGIGGTAFTPIVNYPEVAILGMSRASRQFVSRDGKPVERLLLPLSLSYDHRVVNGADAARFITRVAELLAGPFQLLAGT
jgi:pyruvate dehydrogenase E2 component (dihydrolipoamide acetyltransferase)